MNRSRTETIARKKCRTKRNGQDKGRKEQNENKTGDETKKARNEVEKKKVCDEPKST